MPPPNAPARPNRRSMQSAETRQVIVDAARRLFLEQGYGATSISGIAAEAGVAVQTVYNSVGTKAALLSAVLDAVAAGPNAPTPVPVFMRERASRAADAAEVVAQLADWLLDVNTRARRLWQVIDEAAAAHPEVAELKRERDQRRLRNYGLAAAELRRRGALAVGIGDEELAATIWSLGNSTVYRALVLDAGWTPQQYRQWIANILTSLLTEEATTG